MDFIQQLFEAKGFMPHGHCYLWKPEILWLHVISDVSTGLAYFSIPTAIAYFLIKKPELPFPNIFKLFCAFIFLCGLSHFVSVWTTWLPHYRFEGGVKALMSIVSIITAMKLIPIIPKAIAIPSTADLVEKAEEKNMKLEASNKKLRRFQEAVSGREERVLELKREVNELCRQHNLKVRYSDEQSD